MQFYPDSPAYVLRKVVQAGSYPGVITKNSIFFSRHRWKKFIGSIYMNQLLCCVTMWPT